MSKENKGSQGVALDGAGLSPSVEPASSLDGSATSIPNAEVAAIWRNGVTNTIVLVDVIRLRFANERQTKRTFTEFNDLLDDVLQQWFEFTRSASPRSWQEAEDAFKAVYTQAIEARRAETGTGSVHESAVRDSGCAQASDSSEQPS